ncbi:hypothetical protein LDC_2945 [sediment metagenome]|uniref:Calx-beta domain-containing protein n=1 Tax=sediment metagenome TaxID=749907 RepID=D9PN16_9ZZZZ
MKLKYFSNICLNIFVIALWVAQIDALPIISFASSSTTINEDVAAGKVDVELQLSELSNQVVEVSYDLVNGVAQFEDFGTGQDYYALSSISTKTTHGNIRFEPGTTTKSIAVYVIDDDVVETDELLTITLSTPQNASIGTSSCSLTIFDNDRDIFIDVSSPPAGLAPCIGDGLQDNTTAFQAILDYVEDHIPSTYGTLIYFPTGNYLLNASVSAPLISINPPLNTNAITLMGANSPYTNPERPQSRLFFSTSAPQPQPRMFFNQWKEFNASASTWGMIFRNLILDGGYHGEGLLGWEHRMLISLGATSTDRMKMAIQDCRIQFTTSDGCWIGSNIDARFYNIIFEHNYRGSISSTGQNTIVNVKNVVTYEGYSYCVGGFHGEADKPNYKPNHYEFRDVTLNGGMFLTGLSENSSSYVYAERLRQYPDKLGRLHSSMYGGENGIGEFRDCVFYFTTWPSDQQCYPIKRWKELSFDGCYFVAQPTVTPQGYLGACFVEQNNDARFTANFTSCTFTISEKINKLVNYPDVMFFGFRVPIKDTDKNDVITLKNCTFPRELDAGIMHYSYGNAKLIVDNCTFNNECREIDGVKSTPFTLNGRDDYGSYDWSVTQCTFSTPYLMTFNGFKTVDADDCILRIGNWTTTKADNNFVHSDIQPPTRNTFIPREGSYHPWAITRDSPTIITYPNHGLTTGNKIMWDRISQTNWKDALSPDTNVSIFRVTVLDQNNFSIPLNSTGFASDYDVSLDSGVFWKHPKLRTIIGDEGDDVLNDKPAGFAGDIYKAGSKCYRCITSGKSGMSTWEVDQGYCNIFASAQSNGTIEPSGIISIYSGDTIAFAMKPNPGYRVQEVSVNGIASGNSSSYTFNEVLSSHTIMVSFTRNSFDDVIVYPNPLSLSKSKNKTIKIKNLPDQTTLKIYTTGGELVRELKAEELSAEGFVWDMKDKNSHTIAPGIYFYVLSDDVGNRRKGKIGVTK